MKILVRFIFIFTIVLMSSCKNMKKVDVGSKIPKFELKDQNGNLFKIEDVIGNKNIVIYFYPKDDTPGCTKEACSFRDQYEVFQDVNAMIIGISADSVKSHKLFAEKHRLNYTLLSDIGNKVRKLFGVPKSFFGLFPGRVTYVVDKNGKVVFMFDSQFQVEKHVEKALGILKELK